MYGDWIYQVFALVENYLIQKIDSDEAYNKYESADKYLMATDPDMYELYKALLKIEKKMEENK